MRVISIIYFNEKLKWKLTTLYLSPLQKSRFHPRALWLITSLWRLLIPYTHLTAIHMAFQGQQRFLKCDPGSLSQRQLFTVEKISPWYSAWLAASAEEGGKFARDLVALALLPHLLSLLPKGGSCLSSEHDIPCPRVKRSDCTPRCFTITSCLEKPQRRPQHKQDTYSWQTAAMKKPEWNHSDSC